MRVALARDDQTAILQIAPSAAPPYVAVTLTASTGVSDDAAATQTQVSAEQAAAVSSSVSGLSGAPDAVEIVRRALAVL